MVAGRGGIDYVLPENIEPSKRLSAFLGQDRSSWSYAVIEHEDYVRVIMLGTFTSAKDIIKFSEIVVLSVLVRRMKRVLIDLRQLSADLDPQWLKVLTRQLDQRHYRAMQLRLVCLGSGENIAMLNRVERRLRRISINGRAYCDEDMALSWLLPAQKLSQ